MIYVCNLREMPSHAAELRPSHLVSLVQPADQPPTPPGIAPGRHLRVEIDDITEPMPGLVLPEAGHMSQLIEFLAGWRAEGPLLVHCVAGISRSTAAALIALACKAPRREADLAGHVRRAAPHAQPNARMIELADRLLGCEGRLVAARAGMGPATPLPEGPLVRLRLLEGAPSGRPGQAGGRPGSASPAPRGAPSQPLTRK